MSICRAASHTISSNGAEPAAPDASWPGTDSSWPGALHAGLSTGREPCVGRPGHAADMRPRTSTTLALAGVVLVISACDIDDGTSAGKTDASNPPSPSYATEAEVASVIAGVEQSLRSTADEAADCRILYVMGDTTDPLDKAEMMACHSDEIAAGQTAERVVAELTELEIPPSLTDLATETEGALAGIANIDVESACGPPMRVPKNTDSCSTAHAQRMSAYAEMETALDMWTPYS